MTVAGTSYVVATVLTACGIETGDNLILAGGRAIRCNSTYRLRY